MNTEGNNHKSDFVNNLYKIENLLMLTNQQK